MIAHFLAMGGYAGSVWPAYGITAAAIAATIALTLRRYRLAKAAHQSVQRERQV